jgi:hypothetical protein
MSMSRLFVAGSIVIASAMGATGASAQESADPGPGRVELTLTPLGTTHFFKDATGPSFDNLSAGVSLTYNPTRMIGIEGEVTGDIGIKQNLVGMAAKVRTANMAASSPRHGATWASRTPPGW